MMQALASHKLHEVYTGFADAAGQGGVLRLCVAGDTKLLATTPAAFAAVLRARPFQPKPPGLYNVFFMFVRRSLFPHATDALTMRARPCDQRQQMGPTVG